MDRDDLRQALLEVPVFDTHTHLKGAYLGAEDFWEIAHYFWFRRELEAAGYPSNADDLPEEERIEAFVTAFDATRNTSMNWVVRRIFADLYDIAITDASSVRAADEAVDKSSDRRTWPGNVTGRAGVKKIVVNYHEETEFVGMAGASVYVARPDLGMWVSAISEASDQREAAGAAQDEIGHAVKADAGRGSPGLLVGPLSLEQGTQGLPQLQKAGNSHDLITRFVLECVAEAAQQSGVFLQLFLGMERGWGGDITSGDDPYRINKLHGLFARSGCDFEIVLASAANTLSAVQAARMFPSVNLGGLWWFNFRASTYALTMQQRLEAVPACKSSMVVSDARCIEWCYGKVLLVKYLMADFLHEQIRNGWLDEPEAMRVAREWLHDAAARRYV